MLFRAPTAVASRRSILYFVLLVYFVVTYTIHRGLRPVASVHHHHLILFFVLWTILFLKLFLTIFLSSSLTHTFIHIYRKNTEIPLLIISTNTMKHSTCFDAVLLISIHLNIFQSGSHNVTLTIIQQN